MENGTSSRRGPQCVAIRMATVEKTSTKYILIMSVSENVLVESKSGTFYKMCFVVPLLSQGICKLSGYFFIFPMERRIRFSGRITSHGHTRRSFLKDDNTSICFNF